jgi:hypothetical protein
VAEEGTQPITGNFDCIVNQETFADMKYPEESRQFIRVVLGRGTFDGKSMYVAFNFP